MFGDRDWLRYETAASDIQYLKDNHNVNAKLDIIENAGHHIYLENPTGFSDSLRLWKDKNNL